MPRTPRLLIVGLDPPEIDALRPRLDGPFIASPVMPRWQLREGSLRVESQRGPGWRTVDAVVFHAIFDVEKDFDFLTALTLWRGPCFPSARGLLDCRLRLPCLARALPVSRFGAAPRGLSPAGLDYRPRAESVAKWGNWHCGENKVRVEAGEGFAPPDVAIFEPFFAGEAVRIVRLCGRSWQIRLRGDTWLKSIHHAEADVMEPDEALVEDTARLAEHFGLELVGVDYIATPGGGAQLLEVNHVPNVTRFAAIREAYLEAVSGWAREQLWS